MNAHMVKIRDGYFYDPTKVLGEGCYGKVYKGFSTQLNKVIAVKFVKSAGYNQRQIETLKVLSSLIHPCIMSFYGFQIVNDGVYMFIQFLPNGTLSDLIQKGMNQLQILRVFRQILQGMCYINAKGQMHRDLKPDNILLGDDNQVKICDFGLARQANNDLRMTGQQGTPLYAGPQVYLNKQQKYDQRIDVWSAGLILFEMIKGKDAFAKIKTFTDLHKQWIQFSKGKMQTYDECIHPEWQYFTNIMLTFNADKRPSFDDVLQKLKVLEKRMIDEIKIKQKSPQLKYSEICGSKKYNKVQKYLEFFIMKSELLLQPSKSLLQGGQYRFIKKSIHYLLAFVTISKYLVKLKSMIKNLKYKQLQLPDGEEAVENEKDENQVGLLLDKYRNICQNFYTHYEDKLKNQILKKIFEQFDKNNEDKELYSKKFQSIYVMAVQVKNGCFDMQQDYQQGYQKMLKHEYLIQSQYGIKKMNHDEIKGYALMLLVNDIEKLFPEKSFNKSNPQQYVNQLKNGEYEKLLDFALEHQLKK